MTEIELKFQVPEAARAAIATALAAGRSGRTRLQAVYFDTPDRRLAAAGVALRLRQEGDCWVQTVKAGDPHAMVRHEHDVPLDTAPDGPPPALDLARHAGTPAATLLAGALGGAPVAPLYRTDILRTHRTVVAGAGTLEFALDVGEIAAGALHWPVHELEIELVAGAPVAVLDAAACWVRRHGLWLDTRSKAERGDRLSRGTRSGAPVSARQGPSPGSLQAAAVRALAHLLPNASEVASGSFGPGHVVEAHAALSACVADLQRLGGAPAGWIEGLAAARDSGPSPAALRTPAFNQVLLALHAAALGQPVAVGCTVDPTAGA